MDWADLEVEKLILALPHSMVEASEWPRVTELFAAALRKAKADGYRQGAREFTEEPNHSEPIIEATASQIEKVN